jgi:hypothetical protein
MALPPGAKGLNAILQRGYTTLFWGTEPLGPNLATANAYIVVSARPAQRSETIATQQGSGVTAVTTTVIDGYNFEFTVEEDVTIIPPPVGTIVQLQTPFGAALGSGLPPFGVGSIAGGNYQVENSDFNASRKEVGTRVILARAYAAISAANGGGNPNIGT